MKTFKIRCSAISKILPPNEKDDALSKGVITYLEDWYAESLGNDYEDVQTKYTLKGHLCEDEHIFLLGEKLGIFGMKKNEVYYDTHEYIHGTPDVVEKDFIADVKCSWNLKTFYKSVMSKRNYDYFCQLQGYMILTNKNKAILSYALLDTPEESNYGKYISYSHIPFENRNYQDTFDLDLDFESRLTNKVKQCREYLNDYDLKLKSKLKK